MKETALKEAINGVHLLGIRSRTLFTAEILEAAERLIANAIGAGIEINHWRRD